MCVRQLGSTTIDPTLATIKPTNVNEVKTQENNTVPTTENNTVTDKPSSTEIQRITKDNSSNVGIEKTVSSTSEANVVSFNPTKARAVEKPLSVNAFSIEDEIGFQSVKIDDKEIKDISSNEFKVEYEKFSQPEHALKAALDKATDAAKSHDGIEAIVANYSKDGKVESYSLYKATQADVDKISQLSDEGKYNGKVARFVTPSSILFISYEKNTDIKSSYVHKSPEEVKPQTQNIPNPPTDKSDPIIKNEVVFENGKAEVVSTNPPISASDIVVTRPEQSKIPSYLLNTNLSNNSKYVLDPNLGKLNTGNISLGANGFDFSKPISSTNPPLVLAPDVLDSIQSPFGPWLPSLTLYDPFGSSLFTPFSPSLSLPLSSQLNLNDPSSIANNPSPIQTPKVERPTLNIKELTRDSGAAKKHIEEIEKSVNRNFSDLSGAYVSDSKQLFAKSMEKYTDPKYDSLIKDATLKSAVVKLRNGESFSNDEIMGVAKAVKALPLDKLTPDQLQAVKDFESSFTDFESKMNVLKESTIALDGQLKEQTALLSEMSALVQGTDSNSPSKNVFATFLNKATIASQRKPPNAFEILTNNAALKASMDIISGKSTINTQQATQLQSKVVTFMRDRLKTLPEGSRAHETLSQQINALSKLTPESIVNDKDIRLSLYIATTAEFEMNIQNIAKEGGPDANKKVAELTRNFFGSYVNNDALNSTVRSAESKSTDIAAETEVMHTESFDGTSRSSLSNKVVAANFSSFSAQNTVVSSSIVDTTRPDASAGAEVLSIAATSAVVAINAKNEGATDNNPSLIHAMSWVQDNSHKMSLLNSSSSSISDIDVLADFKKYLAQPHQSTRSDFTNALSSNPDFSRVSSKLQYNFTKTDKLVNVYSDALRECNESRNNLGVGAEWILKKGLVYGETLNKTFEKADASREAAAKYEGDDSKATIEKADQMEAALGVIDSQFAELAGVASISNLLKRFRDIIVELDMNISKSKNENSTRVNIDVSHSKRMEEFKHHLKALDRSRAENNKDFRTSKQVVAAMLPKIKDPKDQLAMSSLIDVLSAIYTPKASSIY